MSSKIVDQINKLSATLDLAKISGQERGRLRQKLDLQLRNVKNAIEIDVYSSIVSEVFDSRFELANESGNNRRLALIENIRRGYVNIFDFYQGTVTEKLERYPVATYLLRMKQVAELASRLGGKIYIVYHDPRIVSGISNNLIYSSDRGRSAYLDQVDYIKQAYKDLFNQDIELINIQEQVSSKLVQDIYSKIKEQYPLEKDIAQWLSWFNTSSKNGLIIKLLGNDAGSEAIENFRSRDENKIVEAKSKINPRWKEIVTDPVFEYNVAEILLLTTMPYLYGATVRPNTGGNRAIQEIASAFSSSKFVYKYFNKGKIPYIPIYGWKFIGENSPISFMSAVKERNGIKMAMPRIDEIKSIDDVIQVKENKEDYLNKINQQIPNWNATIEKAIKLVKP